MSNRIERANSVVIKALNDILRDLNDSRITSQNVYATEVKMSSDFSFCKVIINMDNNAKDIRDGVLKLLNKTKGYLKKSLAQRLDLPHIPEISIELDKGYENSKKIEDILSKLNIPEESDKDYDNYD